MAPSSLYIVRLGSFQDGFPACAGHHPGHYYLAATADDQVGPNFRLTTPESCHLHDRYSVAAKYQKLARSHFPRPHHFRAHLQ